MINIKKQLLVLSLLLTLPILVSWLVFYFWQAPPLLVAGISYLFLLFIQMPAGDILTTNADLETRRINPDYRPPTIISRKLPIYELLTLGLLLALGIGCIYLYVQNL
ncbi:hypothetical protein ACWOFR_06155 [Carnobacterium gallinarum]|uniref:hypothetical protein n=1 Tax=Carnobacterium gallinarum TaxID=2749 RepID=UPI0005568BD0|nr:hypothetical protein [Carnobacterium gallinarum]